MEVGVVKIGRDVKILRCVHWADSDTVHEEVKDLWKIHKDLHGKAAGFLDLEFRWKIQARHIGTYIYASLYIDILTYGRVL